MKRFKLIGLTGQSGAGKSTVAASLAEAGFPVIDADLLVRELYGGGSPCLKAIAAEFGADIIKPDGTPNRPLLAERAFEGAEKTALLGKLVHPFVTALLFERLRGAEGAVIYDAPQLFESGADVICDLVVSVVSDVELRLERITARDGIQREAALSRMNAQYGEEFFRAGSDFIIENNGDLSELSKQTDRLIALLKGVL